MLPDHHRKTASYGRGAKPDAYRKQQAELISKGDFQGAMQMDIKDIRSKFGNLYDDAIEQAVTYSRTKGQ
jgi:filamentous hemagglutinin